MSNIFAVIWWCGHTANCHILAAWMPASLSPRKHPEYAVIKLHFEREVSKICKHSCYGFRHAFACQGYALLQLHMAHILVACYVYPKVSLSCITWEPIPKYRSSHRKALLMEGTRQSRIPSTQFLCITWEPIPKDGILLKKNFWWKGQGRAEYLQDNFYGIVCLIIILILPKKQWFLEV